MSVLKNDKIVWKKKWNMQKKIDDKELCWLEYTLR